MAIQAMGPVSVAIATSPSLALPPNPQAEAATAPAHAGAADAGAGQDANGIDRLRAAMQQVQQAVQARTSSLQFSIDQESGKIVVKLLDTATGDLIRQYPSEEMLAIAHAIDQMQGLLLKQKV